jgi:hypothetical protein
MQYEKGLAQIVVFYKQINTQCITNAPATKPYEPLIQ